MKITVLCLAACLTISSLQAQEATSPSVSGDENRIEGLIFDIQLKNESFGNGIGGGARYWDKYFGAEIGMSFNSTELEASTGASADINSYGLSFLLLAGRQFKNFKPHAFAGVTYDGSDQFGAEVNKMAVRLGLGMDAFITNHFVLGVDILDFSYIFNADVAASALDFDGNSFGFFNAFRIGYLF